MRQRRRAPRPAWGGPGGSEIFEDVIASLQGKLGALESRVETTQGQAEALAENLARRLAPKVHWPEAIDLESRSAPPDEG